MRALKQFKYLFLICILLGAMEGKAFAQGSDGIRVPVISAFGDVGYFTYKSKLADSNDTGLRYGYGFQIFGGDDKELGAAMKTTSMTASFALNENKITQKDQTFIFNYRKSFIYAGAAFGTTQLAFLKANVDTMDAYGNTIGGNLGFLYPFGKGSLVQLDVLALKPSSVKDTQQRTVNLGLKIEVDSSLTFALSKRYVDLILGFKYVQHTATVDGSGGTEKLTIPSVGLRFGANL
ncbi:MAG: hypothetical protein RIR26_150 [Pseudomonadota bacterium]